MRFGLFNLMPFRSSSKAQRQVFQEVIEQIHLVESLDFDIAWFAEHHFSNYCLCPSPLVLAAYCAARTEKIRLGTAVLVLPLYEPVRLIEELALVDILSNGRLVVGVGSGYQDYEFRHFRARLEQSKEIFTEVLDMIELGLTRPEFSYDGKFFTQPATAFCLRPVQRPLPEIWVAGIKEDRDVQLRVARSGYVPFGTAGWNPASTLLDFRKKYEDAYRTVGKDPATMPFAVQRYVYVAETRKDAEEFAENVRYTGRVALSMRLKTSVLDESMLREVHVTGEPTIEQILENAIIGDVETCIEKAVREIRTLRPSHFSCFMQPGAMDQKRVLRSMELFGTKVMPLIERELGDLAAIGSPRGLQPPQGGL
jgi:alkanesulfonate monooxygenase SsuD/methylene tetrahydromethanopterin reductase-like flavin-dependent oxidoreductase (luciferase family)